MKRLISVHHVLPILALLFIPLLVACGGDDEAEATEPVLPTRAALDATTEDVSPEPTEAPTDDAPDTTEPPQPPMQSTPPGDTTAEVGLPDETNTPDAPRPPGIDETVEVDVPGPSTVTDFSQLSAGEFGIFMGTLSVEEGQDGGEPIITVTDEQGNVVPVAVPGPVVSGLDGEVVEIQGTVETASDGSNTLSIRANQVYAEGQPVTQSGPPGDVSLNPLPPEVEVTVDAPAPQGPLANQQQTLDVQLESNLTALEAYDALVDELGDALADQVWFALSGNMEIGWTIEFFDTSASTSSVYLVDMDGGVHLIASDNPLPPGSDVYEIDRERVVVDSDQIEEAAPDEDGPPVGTPVLFLQATPEDTIEWTVQGVTTTTISATEPR